MAKLNEDFLIELFKLCFRRKNIIEICKAHLKYQYLPTEAYKGLFKSILTYYNTQSSIPSIGIIAQEYSYPLSSESEERKRKEILSLIEKIKAVDIPDEENIIKELTDYITDSMAIEFYDRFYEIYSKGERNKARSLLIEIGETISKFSLSKDTNIFEPIFAGFQERQIKRSHDREIGNDLKIKIPFSIDEIDEHTDGGMDAGDTACILMRSGVGKTRFLRHFGVGAARRGFKGLHFSLEGTKEKAEIGFEQTWTAQSFNDLQYAGINEETFKELLNIAESITLKGGEIDVVAYEKFTRPTTNQIYDSINDYYKVHGKFPDFISIDYLELCEPGTGIKYNKQEERFRRSDIAEDFKNIAIETKSRLVTATQASDIEFDLWNNPDWVMTRHNVREAKALPDSFPFFFTGNQTKDEYEMGLMRIYEDKIRDHKGNQIIKIFQSYRHGKFYDRIRTLREILKREF